MTEIKNKIYKFFFYIIIGTEKFACTHPSKHFFCVIDIEFSSYDKRDKINYERR